MISRGMLFLFLIFSASTLAQATDKLVHLEKCATLSPVERKEAFLNKVDCVYRILSEQVGGDETLIKSAIMTGEFQSSLGRIKTAMKEYLGAPESIDEIETVCGKVTGDPLANECIEEKFPRFADRLLTAKAVREVIQPRILPMSSLATIGQLREGHVGLLRKAIM